MTALERFADYMDQHQANYETKKEAMKVEKEEQKFRLRNQFNVNPDAKRLAYGFLNGAVDVFPYASLPDLCRDNVTDTANTFTDLFINSRYVLPDENLEAITAFATMLTYPYGISFSCLFGAQEVFKINRKLVDTTGLDAEAKRLNDMMIVNDVITNVVFNLGYMYSDIANYLTLATANLNYWTFAGDYAGDFMMRFWYRESFSSTF